MPGLFRRGLRRLHATHPALHSRPVLSQRRKSGHQAGLYQAQKTGRLATSGPYARIRHPQYAAFILVMVGFLVQWPTLITLSLFPILVAVYVRLAKREEVEALASFGNDYRAYMDKTPGQALARSQKRR
ncbi:MAG: isoprenylcysteine carboxylmethyltransferase family protein [Dechloromonas sp.]|nr:isoprenylcysteine carboxylmethyltransferase family protein [Dechloromonas sp.]